MSSLPVQAASVQTAFPSQDLSSPSAFPSPGWTSPAPPASHHRHRAPVPACPEGPLLNPLLLAVAFLNWGSETWMEYSRASLSCPPAVLGVREPGMLLSSLAARAHAASCPAPAHPDLSHGLLPARQAAPACAIAGESLQGQKWPFVPLAFPGAPANSCSPPPGAPLLSTEVCKVFSLHANRH